MLKLKKTLTTLILFATMGVGGMASASASSVRVDGVTFAATLAESAKSQINSSNDCQGLNKLLELGPSASGGSPSDALGDLRSELLELDDLASNMGSANLETSRAARSQIDGVVQTLASRLSYCCNGVEKGKSQ